MIKENKKFKFYLLGLFVAVTVATFCTFKFVKFSGNKSVKVSVVIPVYNTEKYLDECLNYVESQTLKEIEIICVNDGSSDNSLQILENHAKNDARIKIINQQNSGVSVARNNGIENATGEYIAFLDSDDIVSPWAYERAYNLATKYNVDIVEFNFHDFVDGEESGVSSLSYRESKMEIKERNASEKPFDTLDFNVNIVWNKLWKKSFIKDNDLSFKKGINRGEDTLFNMLAASSVFKTVRDKNQLYCYRTSRLGSAMALTNGNGKKRLENYLMIMKELSDKRYKINFSGSDQWILSTMIYLVYPIIFDELDNVQDKKYYTEKSLEIINDYLQKYSVIPEKDSADMIDKLEKLQQSLC